MVKATQKINSMKILYQSDIHLEFEHQSISHELTVNDADVIVLAGDIGITDKKAHYDWILEQTNGVPTIFVLGNHEAYKTSWQRAVRKWKARFDGTNVHVLHNDVVFIDGVKFIGTTLWTDFSLFGPEYQMNAALEASNVMTDFKKIRFCVGGAFKKLRYTNVIGLHNEARQFITDSLETGQGSRCVVVTHHAPSVNSLPDNERELLISAADATDLSAIILKYQPSAWIHGHIHRSNDYNIGSTRIVSNPRGYFPTGLNSEFNTCAMIEI